MKSKKGVRGAVSVFLVMILVPCIVVSSVFVDLGRVHMSKSMATSASDLALNSLMTNYDADLSEWYGMAASCQSIEEFYEISAQFFLRTLSSQGLSDDEIILLSDYYANATNDDTIYDLLQIECQTAPSDMISAVSGANLSNATLIKDQTVEFMKYRAPIELTLGIIDRLKSDSSVGAALDSDENKQLVDDKSAYYKAEGELLAAAFNSYVAIYDYYKEASMNGLTNDKLTNYVNKLTEYRNVYLEIHKLYVSNLSNTSGLSRYSRVTINLDKYNSTYTKTHGDIYSRKVTEDDVTHYYIDGDDITDLLDALETEIGDFNTAKSNFESAASSLMGKLPGSGANQSNTIQWWVQMNKAVNSSNGHTTKVKNAGLEMLKAYSKVLAIKDCELGNDIPADWETRFNDLTGQVEDLQAKYLKSGITDSNDDYLKAVKKLEEISNANYGKISAANLYVTVDGQSMNIESALSHIKTQLAAMRSELREYVKLLDIAIDGNEDDEDVPENDKVKSLDALLTLANTYDIKLGNWSTTADNTNTTMADENKQEIADIQQVCQELDEDAVRELKTRLTNIRSQVNAVISGIDSMSYGGTKLKELSTYNAFKTGAQTKVSSSSIGLTNQELTNYANTTFGQLFAPNSNPVMTLSHTNDSKYNPLIDPITKNVDTPELFVYLQEQFGGLSKQDVNQKKEELEGGETAGENKAKEAKEKGRYHGGGSEISKDFSGSETFNIADGAVSGIVDLFDSLINLDITNIRDDLYVTAYIMNMFSYATYENEGLYDLVENKTELTLDNYPTKYQAVMGTGADDEGTWLSESYKDYYNKSLTNKLINKDNNAAYCAEIEYILYGGRTDKGNAENVKSVYSNIYGIRYTLNLVSGFANFWTPKTADNTTATAITTIAAMIQGATGGIVPMALTKVVLIPILTVFETSKDLDRLEAGFPVELYKTTYKEWWVSVPNLDSVGSFTSSMSSGAFSGPNQDNGIFYSDYLMVFVYLGLKSDSAEDMYQRMAEVIQANIRKLSGDNTYSMKKAQVYFKLEATVRVKPLMITLPIFNDYDNNMDTKTDWCTYKISTVRGYS